MPLTFRPIAGWLTPEMTTQRNAWRSFKTHFLSTVVTLSWIARGLALRYVCVLQMSLLGLLACFQAPWLKTIGKYLLRLLFSSSLPWLVQPFETLGYQQSCLWWWLYKRTWQSVYYTSREHFFLTSKAVTLRTCLFPRFRSVTVRAVWGRVRDAARNSTGKFVLLSQISGVSIVSNRLNPHTVQP